LESKQLGSDQRDDSDNEAKRKRKRERERERDITLAGEICTKIGERMSESGGGAAGRRIP